MSIYHYTVNDDIYGKILKTHSNLKPQKKTEYAEVYEAVEGLGIFCYFYLKLLLEMKKLFRSNFACICFFKKRFGLLMSHGHGWLNSGTPRNC